MGWTTDLHPTRAELNACVQCGLCLPHCPTFRLTGLETASPRGRLQAMSAVAAGVAEVDGTFAEMMEFCLLCRACEAVCPGLVPFGRAMEGARAELSSQLPRGRRLRHWLLGRALPNRSLLQAATTGAVLARKAPWLIPRRLRDGLAGMRPLGLGRRSWWGRVVGPDRPPARATVALLAGCVMDAWFPEVHEAGIDLLSRAGFRVVVPPRQTCCGALAAHDGAAAHARRLAAVNLRAFAGADLIVADAAGCSAHLREYGHWVKGAEEFSKRVRDITELVAELIEDGSLPRSPIDRGTVAVQDPCHLRHAQRVLSPPRTILRAAGYSPVEIDPDGLCCGAAGVYLLLRPQAAAELGARKADQVRASGSTVVASANPGCEMQLRSHLEPWFRIAHPVELYRESLDGGL
jgi:glycolate oxidase iron-sulfur subunit